jgi:hypothetical protein
MPNNFAYSTDCKYRTAATLYPRNVVSFRYVIVNTLHKGDNKNNIIVIIIIIIIIN